MSPELALTDRDVLARSELKPDLFMVLIGRYQAAFFRRAKRILGEREEVNDAVAETFTKLYLKAGQFRERPGANFRSWAYQVLFNTCCDYYRRLKLDAAWLSSYAAATGYERELELAESQLAADGWRDLVWSTLARLPLQFSRLLKSYFLDGQSQAEIAAAEGVSVGAIKTRLYRAKQEFKKLSYASYYDQS